MPPAKLQPKEKQEPEFPRHVVEAHGNLTEAQKASVEELVSNSTFKLFIYNNIIQILTKEPRADDNPVAILASARTFANLLKKYQKPAPSAPKPQISL